MKKTWLLLLLLSLLLGAGCALSADAAPAAKADADMIEGKTAYPLAEAEAVQYMSEDVFNIFVQDNQAGSQSLKRCGKTKADMDDYMQSVGFSLRAVPVDAEAWGDNFEIRISIQDGKYPQIGNLKDLGDTELSETAAKLLSGFTAEGYEFYENDQALYIVFDCDMYSPQQRYATIVNGDMIYIFCRSDTELSDAMRDELRQTVDCFIFS